MEQLHPTFGLDRTAIQINFGEVPFLFDVDSMESNEWLNERNKILSMKIPDEKEVMLDWIKDYLIYQGFADTFDVVCQSTAKQDEPLQSSHQDEDSQFLHLRKQVKECIIAGKSLEVVHSIEKQFSSFFHEYSDLIRKLYILHFIQLASLGKVEDALAFATSLNETKYSFTSDDPTDVEILGIIAYTQPMQSPVSHFFDANYKIKLADEVNNAMRNYWYKRKQYNQLLDEMMDAEVTSTIHNSSTRNISKIEMILQQLMATYQQWSK